MKITEDTPQRLTLTCRRRLLADGVFVFCFCFGAIFTNAILAATPGGVSKALAVVPIIFVVVGLLGLLENASSIATLHAADRTLTLRWRRMFRTKSQVISFDDLIKVGIGKDYDFQSVYFTLPDGSTVSPETMISANPQAGDLAQQVNDWLQQQGWKSEAT